MVSGSTWRAALLAVSAVLILSQAKVNAQINNVVTQWLYTAQQTGAALSIPNALINRVYGAVAIAQYDALNRIKREAQYARLEPAAIAYASHRVLSRWFPFRQSPVYDGLLAKQIQSLALPPGLDAKARDAANYAASKILEERLADGVNAWANFIPAPLGVPQSIGKYQWTPGQTFTLYPQVAQTKPYYLSESEVVSIAQRYKAPDITSAAYKKDLEFVKVFGVANSTVRSQFDTDSARFWADGAGTSTVGGHVLNITYAILPPNLSLWKTAKFYAAFAGALFDVNVVCWRVKYRELFWRPITAIRYGDGGQAAIPNWTTQIATPPHPEYPSGHQCTTGVALAVLYSFFNGRDAFSFSLGSEGATDLVRSYTSLKALVLEAGDSRVYAGVHYNVSSNDGLDLGLRVGRLIVDKKFKTW